VDIIA